MSSTLKPVVLLVAEVVEPDPEVRATLMAAVQDLVEPGPPRMPASKSIKVIGVTEPSQVVIIGPGADLSEVDRAARADLASLVLCPADDPDRMVAALRAGAEDAMSWPAPLPELVMRAESASIRRRTAKALHVERRDLAALLDLSEALATRGETEGTMQQIARRVAEVMRSERCSIILLDDKTGIVVADSSDPSITNLPIPVEDNYPEIMEVVRTAVPLVIGDVHEDPLFEPVRDKIREVPVRNTALFPVLVSARVQGVLLIRGADVRPEGLSDRQLRFGTIVANATSIAIRNARTYQSIRQRAERVISARIRAERRLRQLEKYQRFFDLAGDGLAIVDGRGQIVFANRAAQVILGFSDSDMTQLRLADIVEDEALPIVEELVDGFRAGRQSRRLDLPVVRADGTRAMLSLSTSSLDPDRAAELAVSGPSSNVAAIVSIRDVTETVRIQNDLATTSHFLEKLIQSSPDAIVAADITGRIVLFNPGAEMVTGYRADDILEKMNVEALYPEGVAREIMARLRSDRHGGVGKYDSGRHELRAANGDLVPIEISASLIYEGDEAVASVGIFSDLRERIRMEAALEHAQRKLEVSERQAAVIELAGTAAHELSQPLTTILGSAELAARKLSDDSPSKKQLERIMRECDRMVDMLKKFGKITKYETKPYLGYTNILDLDAASASEEKP